MDDLLIVLACIAPLAIRWLLARGQAFDAGRFAAMGLGLAFFYFALGHVVVTNELVVMLPPWVPEKPLLIYFTGALEAATAIALLTRRWRRLGAFVAIAMLVLFLPANIYATVNHVGIGDHKLGPAYLWIRVPLQVFLVVWAYWPTRRRHVPA